MKNYTYTKADGTVSDRYLADIKITKESARAIDLTGLGPDEADVVYGAIVSYQKSVQKDIDEAIKQLRKGYATLEEFVEQKTGIKSKAWSKNFVPSGLVEKEE